MATPPNDRPVLQTLATSLEFEQNTNQMSNSYPIILNNSYPITQSLSDDPLQPISISTSHEEIPSLDFSRYENRLKTFDGNWELQFITPAQMAKAGLYYIGPQDRVECAYCSSEFNDWKNGDNPFDEHRKWSPRCAFFNDSSGNYKIPKFNTFVI